VKVLAVARLTLAEAAKRRLLLTGGLVSLAFVGLFLAAFWFIDTRATTPEGVMSALASTFLTIFGLYTIYFLTGVLSVFLAAGAVSGDVDNGILHAILARPLSRAQYLFGRWAGLAALVTGYVAVMGGSLLVAAWLFADYVALDPWATMGLLALQALCLLSLALLGSTLLPTVANGVAVLALFGLAWLGGIIGGVGRSVGNETLATIATVVGVAVPSDALWRAASYFAQSPLLLVAGEIPGIPFASTVPPSAAVVTWGLAYPLVALGFAVLAFSRRDL